MEENGSEILTEDVLVAGNENMLNLFDDGFANITQGKRNNEK